MSDERPSSSSFESTRYDCAIIIVLLLSTNNKSKFSFLYFLIRAAVAAAVLCYILCSPAIPSPSFRLAGLIVVVASRGNLLFIISIQLLSSWRTTLLIAVDRYMFYFYFIYSLLISFH